MTYGATDFDVEKLGRRDISCTLQMSLRHSRNLHLPVLLRDGLFPLLEDKAGEEASVLPVQGLQLGSLFFFNYLMALIACRLLPLCETVAI